MSCEMPSCSSLPTSRICLYVDLSLNVPIRHCFYESCSITMGDSITRPFRIRFADMILVQNAMNAAEITDKLGLHSLRQRAWVGSISPDGAMAKPANMRPTVHPVDLCHIRRWSLRGSRMARHHSPKGWPPVNQKKKPTKTLYRQSLPLSTPLPYRILPQTCCRAREFGCNLQSYIDHTNQF